MTQKFQSLSLCPGEVRFMSSALMTRTTQSYPSGSYSKSSYKAVTLLQDKTRKQVFIVATWQKACLLTDEWLHRRQYIHTMEHYVAIKRK